MQDVVILSTGLPVNADNWDIFHLAQIYAKDVVHMTQINAYFTLRKVSKTRVFCGLHIKFRNVSYVLNIGIA